VPSDDGEGDLVRDESLKIGEEKFAEVGNEYWQPENWMLPEKF
jgi:hypothetical protein